MHWSVCMGVLYPLMAVLYVLSGQEVHPTEGLKAFPWPHTHCGSARSKAMSLVPAAHLQDVLSTEGSVMYGHTLHPLPLGLYNPAGQAVHTLGYICSMYSPGWHGQTPTRESTLNDVQPGSTGNTELGST